LASSGLFHRKRKEAQGIVIYDLRFIIVYTGHFVLLNPKLQNLNLFTNEVLLTRAPICHFTFSMRYSLGQKPITDNRSTNNIATGVMDKNSKLQRRTFITNAVRPAPALY
jgi:hypothetical protein